jgi:signal transduction histidine kinase
MEKANSVMGRAPRVLIVEDDSESVPLLKTLIRNKGFEVSGTASNGAEALEKYKEIHPDIVTMDIMMPTVDGKTCSKNILEYDPRANIVVVSVLGHDELEALKSIGVKAFIKKPIDIDELFNAMKNISVSLVKDEKGDELGAVGMAQSREKNQISGGLFIEIIRHDTLNPIGLIKNFAEVIKDDASETMMPQIDAIIRNADKIIEIIKGASRLSKIDKLKSLDLDKRDISEMIKDAESELANQFDEKHIKLENKVEDGLMIDANPLMKNVIYQLLSNAAKYSPEKSTVLVDAQVDSEEVLLSVKDNGVGVKDDFKKTIFHRFENPKKGGVKGTGIGLAIVEKIVELHNGSVWVEDNPTGGSIFKVKLPKTGVGRRG